MVLLSFIILFSPLSVVLKHLDHFLVATHELATFIQHTSIDETTFLHDSSRCRIACKMVCPDVFEMLLSFKSDLFCKFHKIVIRPNIQLFGIPDKRQHVSLYLIHVCRDKSFILKERLLVKLFVIELQGSFAQVSKVKRNIVANIPFEVIPITSLNSVLPGTIHQCMHLSCKEGWQSED